MFGSNQLLIADKFSLLLGSCG